MNLSLQTSDAQTTKVVSEAYRLAEQHLQAQVQIALAADQRAMSFCGLVVAAIAALVGFTEGDEAAINIRISVGCLAVSAALSAWSARPALFQVHGLPFKNFEDDIKDGKTYSEVISELGAIFDEQCEHNKKCIKRNARFFSSSILLAILGVTLMAWPLAGAPLLRVFNAIVEFGFAVANDKFSQ